MTTTHDLRFAWLDTLVHAGAPDDDDTDDTEDEDTDDLEDDTGADGDDTEGDDDEQEEDDEAVSNPRIKKLSEEAKRHRLAAKAEKDRADAAEAALAASQGDGTVRALRIELAATKANLTRAEPFKDLEAAMAMVDLSAVKVDDDGKVSGLDDALDYVAKRYPYMVDDSGTAPRPPADDDDTIRRPSGRQTNGSKAPSNGLNRTTLEAKFPALRRRR